MSEKGLPMINRLQAAMTALALALGILFYAQAPAAAQVGNDLSFNSFQGGLAGFQEVSGFGTATSWGGDASSQLTGGAFVNFNSNDVTVTNTSWHQFAWGSIGNTVAFNNLQLGGVIAQSVTLTGATVAQGMADTKLTGIAAVNFNSGTLNLSNLTSRH